MELVEVKRRQRSGTYTTKCQTGPGTSYGKVKIKEEKEENITYKRAERSADHKASMKRQDSITKTNTKHKQKQKTLRVHRYSAGTF